MIKQGEIKYKNLWIATSFDRTYFNFSSKKLEYKYFSKTFGEKIEEPGNKYNLVATFNIKILFLFFF